MLGGMNTGANVEQTPDFQQGVETAARMTSSLYQDNAADRSAVRAMRASMLHKLDGTRDEDPDPFIVGVRCGLARWLYAPSDRLPR